MLPRAAAAAQAGAEPNTTTVSIPAANRDPARFADPDTLDLLRPTSGHVTFGHTVYGAARRVHRMDAIRAAGGHPVEMDVRIGADLDRAVATVLDEQGRIDVLVNNAGTVLHGAVEDVPLDRARDQLEVNLVAPARLIQPGIINTEFEDQTAAQLREFSGDTAYGHMAEAMAQRSETGLSEGSEPSVVAEAIRHAIESGEPQTRYAVGWLADKLLELNRTLPDREFDALATRSIT